MAKPKFDKVKELTGLRERSKRPIFSIIDGNFYLNRALHAYPPRLNSEGIPVAAVAGALAMFCSDYSILKPKYCAITFDVPGPNFRHRILESYKLNNVADVENYEVNVQLFILVRLCKLVGFPVVFLQGVEADDSIGALATQALDGTLFDEPVNVVIQSGDKDITQFVHPRCVMMDTRDTGWLATVKTVREKFGVDPNQIADYLALCGDVNDGVPGLEGIGPVKARELLSTFGSIKGILDAKKFDDKWKKLITPSSLADLRMCYKLTRIRVDVNVGKYGPFVLHNCHARYLGQALASLQIKPPSLVTAQIAKAALEETAGLFDTDDKPRTLVEDNDYWEGLMGNLWKLEGSILDKAEFTD